MSNIIFHIPWKIKEGRKSATAVRPLEMLKAFRDAGHSVDTVMGDSKERLNSINLIKDKLKSGCKYDFIYSESSVAPTFIASGWKDYIKYGSIDFKFLKYCRKRDIPLGIFYRDVYWRYPSATNDSSLIKRLIMQIAYRLDLVWYNRWVSVLYLPGFSYEKLLGKHKCKVLELPPGGNISSDTFQEYAPTEADIYKLKLFYVGGATNGYKLHKLFKVVSEMKDVQLTFCTREKEWLGVKNEYILSENINVIFKSGPELDNEYKNCDLALLYFQSDEYRVCSIPYKMFEYISYNKPIIATKETAAGEWVSSNNAGWSIPYKENELKTLLESLINNPELINTKLKILNDLKKVNRWEDRVKKVTQELTI